jgi:hypothetical protein
MRIRTIKPEFWAHPLLSRLDDSSRLLAIGLLNVADDKGYFLADPLLIRSQIWPLDESSSKARRTLDDLSRAGYIEIKIHASHGEIGYVVNFTKHQKVDRPNESKIKTYFDSSNDRRMIVEQSSTDQGSGIRDQGKDQGAGKGSGETEDFASAPVSPKVLKAPAQTDTEWLLSLETDSTYSGINVLGEHGKMVRWCEVNRKSPSRKRFVNWLNRIEKPMKAQNTRTTPDDLLSAF